MKNKIMYILIAILFMPINVLAESKVTCGNINPIAAKVPEITSWIVTIIQVAVPIILVIMGSIDFVKAIIGQKEDEMKQKQQIFIKRLITSILIFFVVAITKIIVGTFSSANKTSIVNCIDCFISNKCTAYVEPTKEPKTTTPKQTNTQTITGTKVTTDSNEITTTSKSSNRSSSKKSTSSSSRSSNNESNNNSMLIIGDSRTEGMCGELCNACTDAEYIAKGSMGYDWFANTAVNEVNNKIKSKNYNIFILMGVNGAGSDGTDSAKKYFDKISKLAKTEWKDQNIIFISVNPVNDNGITYTYMSGVNSFNKKIKDEIDSAKISNFKYCDTASKMTNEEINSGKDGLHYDCPTYKKIYSLLKDCIK